jgi:hypothetical protein
MRLASGSSVARSTTRADPIHLRPSPRLLDTVRHLKADTERTDTARVARASTRQAHARDRVSGATDRATDARDRATDARLTGTRDPRCLLRQEILRTNAPAATVRRSHRLRRCCRTTSWVSVPISCHLCNLHRDPLLQLQQLLSHLCVYPPCSQQQRRQLSCLPPPPPLPPLPSSRSACTTSLLSCARLACARTCRHNP